MSLIIFGNETFENQLVCNQDNVAKRTNAYKCLSAC
jgi:hypothetical protein